MGELQHWEKCTIVRFHIRALTLKFPKKKKKNIQRSSLDHSINPAKKHITDSTSAISQTANNHAWASAAVEAKSDVEEASYIIQ